MWQFSAQCKPSGVRQGLSGAACRGPVTRPLIPYVPAALSAT